ncbi:MAG: DUF2437 domain-containing protein, partial [Acidobacteria bacterium]|nr:DUF2437 domain-containing protein [Acidobacteriota bacterium]
MKICSFIHKGNSFIYGVLEGEVVRRQSFKPWEEVFGNDWPFESKEIALSEVKLVAPIKPSKIVCVGRNYREHAAELGNPMPTEPLLFLKAPSSI